MPELPEVETMRRGIAVIVGSKIARVSRAPCKLRPIEIRPQLRAFDHRTRGTTITGLGRAGKRLVIELDSSEKIVIEPRMTGLALLSSPPDEEHLRLKIELDGGSVRELVYWDSRGLGSVRLLRPKEFQLQLGPAKLGPDAIATTAELIRERLRTSRRAIKVALLDQRAVAGIGNLYAAEILHVAGIHPERTCDSLRPNEWDALHRAMVAVLEAAIQYEGSTLADGTYRNALNQSGNYQQHHRVYDQEGNLCGACGKGTIVRIVQAQRSTFFCPVCQKPRSRRRNSPRGR